MVMATLMASMTPGATHGDVIHGVGAVIMVVGVATTEAGVGTDLTATMDTATMLTITVSTTATTQAKDCRPETW